MSKPVVPPINAWCERLGIGAPRVEDLVGRPNVKLLHLVVCALLERGTAMTLDELAERLLRAGAVAASGDMRVSITKGRRAPVLLESDGRFALDLASEELDLMLFLPMKLRGPKVAFEPRVKAVPPVLPGPEVPARREEIAPRALPPDADGGTRAETARAERP